MVRLLALQFHFGNGSEDENWEWVVFVAAAPSCK